ncbi:MAG: DUF1761 domain-containing protein [Rhizobiaceae bacterium]
MAFLEVNFIAIILAAIAGMITGAVWYGVFAKQWMNAVGLAESDIEQKPSLYIVAVIAQIIIAYILARLLGHFDNVGLTTGIAAAFFLWLGFCLAPMAVNHRFQNKGWDLTVIDGGFWLVVFLLQGAIIGWFSA